MHSTKRGSLLLRNTLASASSGILAQILALITFPFLLKQVGVEDYGIFALASATVGYFAILNMAARSSVVKFTAEYNEIDKTALNVFFSNAVLINFILGVVIACFLAITALWCDKLFTLKEENILRAQQILFINAAAALISQPLSVYGSLLYGLQRYMLVATLDVLWTFSRNSIILLIYFFNGSILWLVWEEVLMQLIKFTALKIIVKKKISFFKNRFRKY